MDRIVKVCQIVAIAYYLLLITGNECQTPQSQSSGNEIDKLISEIFDVPATATTAEAGNRGGDGEVYPQPQPQPTPQPQPQPQPTYPITQPTVVQPETRYPPPTAPPPVHQEPEYIPPPQQPSSQYPPPTGHPTGPYPKPSEVPVSDPNPMDHGPNVSESIDFIWNHSVQLIDFIQQ